jgi:hypothetical protein
MSGCCVGNFNICIQQGASYIRVFTWIAGGCGCNTAGAGPTPVDLTGYSGALQIRPYPGSDTVLYDASADLSSGGVDGTITLNIPASATQGFTWWNGVYDLLLTSPQGEVTKLLSGAVIVCPVVTNVGQFVLLPAGQAGLVPSGQGVLTP